MWHLLTMHYFTITWWRLPHGWDRYNFVCMFVCVCLWNNLMSIDCLNRNLAIGNGRFNVYIHCISFRIQILIHFRESHRRHRNRRTWWWWRWWHLSTFWWYRRYSRSSLRFDLLLWQILWWTFEMNTMKDLRVNQKGHFRTLTKCFRL